MLYSSAVKTHSKQMIFVMFSHIKTEHRLYIEKILYVTQGMWWTQVDRKKQFMDFFIIRVLSFHFFISVLNGDDQ